MDVSILTGINWWGQAFLFKGSSAMDVVDKLEKIGFTRLREKPDGFLLTGKDDNTGQAIVVSVVTKRGLYLCGHI